MDLATLIGLIGGIAVVVSAISTGSSLGQFIDISSVLIVLGGTLTALFIKFPFAHVFDAFRVATKAFHSPSTRPEALITQINQLANQVRAENLLSLEKVMVKDPFLDKGVQLALAGREAEFICKVLEEDISLESDRHDVGVKIFRAIGESAPAFGMIGTLVGLVKMLGNMSDPSSIGPAMAIALLTTLYGALIANLVALPIADKLELRAHQESLNKSLIMEGLPYLMRGENPKILDELLITYLPHKKRAKLHEQVAKSAAPKANSGT